MEAEPGPLAGACLGLSSGNPAKLWAQDSSFHQLLEASSHLSQSSQGLTPYLRASALSVSMTPHLVVCLSCHLCALSTDQGRAAVRAQLSAPCPDWENKME